MSIALLAQLPENSRGIPTDEDDEECHHEEPNPTRLDWMLKWKGLREWSQRQVLDIGNLEAGDILDITVSYFWRGIGPVLVQDSIQAPVLQLAYKGNHTSSSVL